MPEHEFLSTLYVLALSTDLNMMRGEYFQKNEVSHLYLFFMFISFSFADNPNRATYSILLMSTTNL